MTSPSAPAAVPVGSSGAAGRVLALGSPALGVNPPVSGTVYQNTSGAPLQLTVPITYNPTGVAAATCAVAIGPTNNPATSWTESEPATLVAGTIQNTYLTVPAGWYFKFTVVNATIGVAFTIGI